MMRACKVGGVTEAKLFFKKGKARNITYCKEFGSPKSCLVAIKHILKCHWSIVLVLQLRIVCHSCNMWVLYFHLC